MKRYFFHLITWPVVVVIVLCGGIGLLFEGIAVSLACLVDRITGCPDEDKTWEDIYND
jgi:hypothetical protein